MFATLFASLFVQGILLGLAALALLAAAPRLQKRYGPQWLCRLWVTLAVLLLVPLHALVPQAPGGGVRGYHTAVQPDRPFAGSHRAPRRRCALHGCAHGLHRAPR